MKLLFILTLFFKSNAFINKSSLKLYNITKFKKSDKVDDYLELIRYKNILPTFLLNFSGAFISNPSFDIFHFIISSIDTILILASSMIINDLFDINIDKINNPTRPLITGKITINEAKIITIILLSIVEILTINYLPIESQMIIQYAIINIIIYTPIIKKITFIKNISCASLIAFVLYFSSLTINNLLITTTSFIFFGSLSNELLLDITDYEGDKKKQYKYNTSSIW
jgi:geranylgeranylglycerol-phosphate geranylgeranyltransferase